MEIDLKGIRIGVMANRFKTKFYHEVFERMGLPRENIFWVCTGRPWLEYLTKAGYSRDNIYYYEVADNGFRVASATGAGFRGVDLAHC